MENQQLKKAAKIYKRWSGRDIFLTSPIFDYEPGTNSIDSTTYLKHKPLSLVSLKAVCDLFGIKIRK